MAPAGGAAWLGDDRVARASRPRPWWWRGVLLAAVLLALGGLAACASGSDAAGAATAAVRLDGVRIRPEVARTPAERKIGLSNRSVVPADGMLFVFPADTRGGFWMKDTRVRLRIVFFDARGRRVRAFVMVPCPEEPCPVYAPGRPYRFALELPAADRRPARLLGPLTALRRLTRAAR